jgi:WS/DGAT/MGAT family acyltransferase
MNAFDAGFLYFERPHAPLTIGCVAVLDSVLSRTELVRHFEARLGRVPRYAQRTVPAPFSLAHPSWEDAPQLDLRDHVHRRAIPWPGGEAELCEEVEELMSRPLDRTRPLWEAHLLEGLQSDRSALLHKVHHCMLDGVAGTGVLDALLDPQASASRPRDAEAPPLEPSSDAWGRLGRALVSSLARPLGRSLEALRHPGGVVTSLAPLREVASWTLRRTLEGPSALPWNGPVGFRRRLAFARLPLGDARVIGQAQGATVNDVILCMLAGGLRRYLEGAGIEIGRRPVTALVPVSLRVDSKRRALGNQLAPLLVPLVVEPDEETERLALTASITRRLKQARGHSGVATLLAAADLLPAPVVAWAGSHVRIPTVASVIATNVRGPAQPRYLCGRRVEALYPIVPLVDGLGLGLAVLSYGGTLHVGLNADADRVPDLEKLAAGIVESFARLRASL